MSVISAAALSADHLGKTVRVSITEKGPYTGVDPVPETKLEITGELATLEAHINRTQPSSVRIAATVGTRTIYLTQEDRVALI